MFLSKNIYMYTYGCHRNDYKKQSQLKEWLIQQIEVKYKVKWQDVDPTGLTI